MMPTWLPQKPAMTAGMPCSVPFSASTPGMPAKSLPGKHLVQMAREDGVDAGHLRQVQRGVLLAALALAALDAGMAERQQNVALAAQIGHMPLRGVDDVLRRHLAGEMALVPLHDLRRHEADDADAQPLLAPGFVHDLLVEHHPGLHQRRAVGLDEVGADERETWRCPARSRGRKARS